MCPIRNLKAVSALLISAAMLSPTAAHAAKLPKTSRANAPRVQSKAKNLPKQIQRAPTSGYRQSHENNMMRRTNEARVQSKTKTRNMPTEIQLRPRVIVQSAPAGKTAKKPKPVTSANSAIRANGSNLNNIAQRAGNIRTKVGEQTIRDLNSSSAGAIENAMPGFTGRGAKGAKGLKDLGSTAGNNRNPVTTAGGLGDFAGGGSGRFSEGGKGSSTATHHQDGSTTLKYADGTVVDVWKDGTIVTENPDGTTEVDSGNDSPAKVYDKDGKYVGTKPTTGSNGGGTTGGGEGTTEPVDDATGSGGSGEPVITAETLRGLNARANSKGEPTGDEGTTGGAVDNSKTRQGRINQVGQPTEDGVSVRSAPTSMEVNQAIRVRLRNVTPIQR